MIRHKSHVNVLKWERREKKKCSFISVIWFDWSAFVFLVYFRSAGCRRRSNVCQNISIRLWPHQIHCFFSVVSLSLHENGTRFLRLLSSANFIFGGAKRDQQKGTKWKGLCMRIALFWPTKKSIHKSKFYYFRVACVFVFVDALSAHWKQNEARKFFSFYLVFFVSAFVSVHSQRRVVKIIFVSTIAFVCLVGVMQRQCERQQNAQEQPSTR